jgi:hypothetical protein
MLAGVAARRCCAYLGEPDAPSTEASSSEKEESNNNSSSEDGMHESDKTEVDRTSKESGISKLVSDDAFLRLKSLSWPS